MTRDDVVVVVRWCADQADVADDEVARYEGLAHKTHTDLLTIRDEAVARYMAMASLVETREANSQLAAWALQMEAKFKLIALENPARYHGQAYDDMPPLTAASVMLAASLFLLAPNMDVTGPDVDVTKFSGV